MPAPELQIGNRSAYLRKAITSPDFSSERVLARDAFQFAELWLKRECQEALPFWNQSHSYYVASRHLPAQSSPLTSYYCFLNAAKSLLTVKGIDFSDYHGVSGEFDPSSKRALQNEMVAFKGGGILPALSKLLQEEEMEEQHSLTEMLANLPFIHRPTVTRSGRIPRCSFPFAASSIEKASTITSGSQPILRGASPTDAASERFPPSLRWTRATTTIASFAPSKK